MAEANDAAQGTDDAAAAAAAEAEAQAAAEAAKATGDDPPAGGDGTGQGDGITSALSDPDGGDGEGDGDGKAAAPADWPDDWKQRMAGGDDKLLKRINRFASPGNVIKSLVAAEQKIRSGDTVPPFPADGSDEDKAAWREQQGIPKEAGGYLEDMPNGLVIGDDDKEMMTTFAQAMHDHNAPPGIVHTAIDTYYKIEEQRLAEVADRDEQQRQETEDALRTEWGNDYRPMMRRIHAHLDGLGEGVKDAIMNARDVRTGRPLASTPEILLALAQTAVEINPAGTIVPAGTTDVAKSVADEIAEIEAMIPNQGSAYYTGPKEANGNTKLFNRLRELYEYEENQKARAKERAA